MESQAGDIEVREKGETRVDSGLGSEVERYIVKVLASLSWVIPVQQTRHLAMMANVT